MDVNMGVNTKVNMGVNTKVNTDANMDSPLLSSPHERPERAAQGILDTEVTNQQAKFPKTPFEPSRTFSREVQVITTTDSSQHSATKNLSITSDPKSIPVSTLPADVPTLLLALRNSVAENTDISTISPEDSHDAHAVKYIKTSLEMMQVAAATLHARYLFMLSEALQPFDDPASGPAYVGLDLMKRFVEIRRRTGPSSFPPMNRLEKTFEQQIPKVDTEIEVLRTEARKAKSAQYREAIAVLLVIRFLRRKIDRARRTPTTT
ncbi:hypothetical protein ACHAO9_011805 [Fusarium lateritium]